MIDYISYANESENQAQQIKEFISKYEKALKNNAISHPKLIQQIIGNYKTIYAELLQQAKEFRQKASAQ